MKNAIPFTVLLLVVLACGNSDIEQRRGRSTPDANAKTTTRTDAENIQEVKGYLKPNLDPSSYFAAYTLLKRVGESSPQHAEAKQLLDKWEPQFKAAVRETIRYDYENSLRDAFPGLNNIKAKVIKSGKGYALLGYHTYFTSSTFDIGRGAGKVQDWISDNEDDLRYSQIVRVGVSSTGDYGSQWYDVK